MAAFYNEIDPFAAQWLRNLISAGLIAPGIVDERSIEDIHPEELRDFTQCHFFAGIGVWSHALRLAGWPNDRPVWTGSCPCQPFSSAGKGGGFADERHLWPAFHHLIRECRPPVVFGEQVASKDGLAWFDLVQADLEGEGYAVGAADLCAAGVGAPHIRQRLYWVADSSSTGLEERAVEPAREEFAPAERGGDAGGLVVSEGKQVGIPGCTWEPGSSRAGGLVLADRDGSQPRRIPAATARHGDSAHTTAFWADADWLLCRDGKWRPVESGTFPVAHGTPARVVRTRGYGNAIVAQVAETFVKSYMDLKESR